MRQIFKVTVAIICITMFINFVFTAGFGVYKTFHAFYVLYSEGALGKPGLEIVESLDLFLVALVFLILALGFMKLFYPNLRVFSSLTLPWLNINDFFQLKQLTWQAVLLTLLITFGTHVLRSIGSLEWTVLIVPVSVLLFSLSARFLPH